MELIREKDQVLNEFYSYAAKNAAQQRPSSNFLNLDIENLGVPEKLQENVVVLHKLNDSGSLEDATNKDTRRGIQPANEASLEIIEMHSKKYHETLEPGDDYLSLSLQSGLKTKELMLSTQGMKHQGRQMPYVNYKSA